MHDSLIEQGMDLLVFGMGTVYVFLTLLVLGVSLMSWVLARFFAEKEEPSPVFKKSAPAPAAPSGPVAPGVLMAIQEAIYQHRARHHP